MTQPNRADTAQMRRTSEAIEGTYQSMRHSSNEIVNLLGKLYKSIDSPDTDQSIRKLRESLSQSDSAIRQKFQELAEELGNSATAIEQILRESRSDIDDATAEVRAAGTREYAI